MPTAAAPASHLLFTYGTLMLTTGIAVVDDAMRKAGVSMGRGYVHGHLYDLGEYPGAVATGTATALTTGNASAIPDDDEPRVWGHLLRLADPETLFAVLDPYEGFDAANPAASEFVRARVGVLLAGSETPLEAQIYWYNFPLPGRARIDTGDYLAHWAAKGKPRQARIR